MEGGRIRTLVLPDVRGGDRVLRVTWHPASGTVVFSHWTGSVCTASTPVRLADASTLIELLVGALRDLASGAAPTGAGGARGARGAGRSGRSGPIRGLAGVWRRIQPAVARVQQMPGRPLSHRPSRAAR